MTPMTNLVRRPVTAGPALILAVVLAHPLTNAQVPTAPAAGGAEQGVSERVKKEAASPLYWIRLNAQSAGGGPARTAARIAETRPAATAPRRTPHRVEGDSGRSRATVATGGSDAMPVLTGQAPEVAAELAAPGAFAATSPPLTDDANEPLTLISGGEPEFPTSVMRRLRKGAVQVSFEVQPDGSVSNAAVVQTPHDSLNAAALKAVAGWRFRPADGMRSAVVDLGFDLDG